MFYTQGGMCKMFRGTSLWAGIISGGLSQLEDTRHLRSGQMNRSQYAANTTRNVTMAVGVMAGMGYGAVLGSAVFPGIGTIVGSVIGGLVGDRVGRTVGMEAGNMIFNTRPMNMGNQLPNYNASSPSPAGLLQNQSEA
jgi:outer membrane lipoprotein SlyB